MTDFTELVDLSAESLGGRVIVANDEFFAPKEAMLKESPAEWREGVYTERGKWMDGWETRRRRTPGYDWAVVRLGARGVIRGVVIDTAFYRGNFPERASIEVCDLPGTPSADSFSSSDIVWRAILPESALAGDTKNAFAVNESAPATHLRLNIFPDGGVARLRVYGDVTAPDHGDKSFDLAAIENGGYSVVCSDMFFGHRQNLLMPGRSSHMGNGWETKRRRGPGHDWTVIRLAKPGTIERVELDTDHFKGNAPGSCMLEVATAPGMSATTLASGPVEWVQIVPQTPLQPHARHTFDVMRSLQATHARLNIYPDGGVARLRLFGR